MKRPVHAAEADEKGLAGVGADELGWHWPYEQVHHLEELSHDLPLAGVLSWLTNTFVSAVVGLIVGGLVVAAMKAVPRKAKPETASAH